MDSKYIDATATEAERARFYFFRVNKSGADRTAKRIAKAAEYLWNISGDKGTEEKPKFFADLTKGERLQFLADYMERIINDAAAQQVQNELQAAAVIDLAKSIEDN